MPVQPPPLKMTAEEIVATINRVPRARLGSTPPPEFREGTCCGTHNSPTRLSHRTYHGRDDVIARLASDISRLEAADYDVENDLLLLPVSPRKDRAPGLFPCKLYLRRRYARPRS